MIMHGLANFKLDTLNLKLLRGALKYEREVDSIIRTPYCLHVH